MPLRFLMARQARCGPASRAMNTGMGLGLAVSLALGLLALAPAARAQRVVAKIGTICPLGYVDTLNGRCTTFGLATYTVQPTNGKACPEGWMNVGGGYCRRK